jgi:TM2 domain-containing membrane protein YozV
MTQGSTTAGPAMKECPFCAEQISINAKKCKHCGETIDVTLRVAEEARRSNNGSAGNIVVNNALNNSNSQQATQPVPVVQVAPVVQVNPAFPPKSRAVYIVLAILLGSIGVHNFYAGYYGRGIVQLILGLTTVGMIISYPWAIIEAIIVKHDARNIPFA